MANKVWVVLQQREGQLARMSWEAIAAAQKLAGELGGKAEAVLLGANLDAAAAEVARRDLAAVHVADAPGLATYTPGGYVAALAPAIRAAAPDFVVFPHSYQSVDYVPRLAQAVWAGLLPEVTGFQGDPGGLLWRRPILGGKMQAEVRVKGEGTVLVSVQAGAFQADGVAMGTSPAPISPLAADLSAVRPDREVLGVEQVGGGEDRLDQGGDHRRRRPRRRRGRQDGDHRGARQGARRRDRRQPPGDRQRLAAARPPDRLLGPDRRPQALPRGRYFRRHPAPGGDEGIDDHRRDQ